MQSKRYKFGIIGNGEVVEKHHIPAIEKMNGIIVDIVDSNGDYRDILNNKEIEVVSICTPNYLHVPQAIDALNAGKKVILEKPIATTFAQAQKLLLHPLADTVAVCYQRRLNKECLEIKQKGKPLLVEANISLRRDDYYWKTWRSDMVMSGGGNLMNIDIHYLDLLLWWLGDSYTILYANIAQLQNHETDGAVRVVMDFAGTRVNFTGSAIHDKKEIFMKAIYPSFGEIPNEVLMYSNDDATHYDVYSQFLNHNKYVTVEEAFKSLKLVKEIYEKAKE